MRNIFTLNRTKKLRVDSYTTICATPTRHQNIASFHYQQIPNKFNMSKLLNASRNLRKSKSMCSLNNHIVDKIPALHKERSFCGYGRRHSHTSESSVEVYVVNDTDSETSAEGGQGAMPLLEFEGEMLSSLEQKIDRLSGESVLIINCRNVFVTHDKIIFIFKTVIKTYV